MLPALLPRENRVLVPQQHACPACSGRLKSLGEGVSEQLEIIDAAFKVIRYIQRRKACACCDVVVQVSTSSRLIKYGIPAPGLLAHILVLKFADY